VILSTEQSASVGNATLPRARIVRRKDCTDDLFLLWLAPEIPFDFSPGQYITIGAGGIERPYSIASAPYEPDLELFIEFVLPEHGGKLTPLLFAQHVGDVVTMRPKAKGRFTLRPGPRNHVMVATVTGVAPYVSMIRQFVHEKENAVGDFNDRRFFVMLGASHQDEFVYDREFHELSQQYPDLIRLMCSVSRPWADRNAGWVGPVGRINLLIEEHLDRWELATEDTLIYLCGNPGMINDASARLRPRGWSLVSEQFWRAPSGD
jgi:ferredoxin--NADP+ reductase